ncbi:MAG: hypothetical protein M5U34_38545 [Chloroflexi bacterium]|nr:hypothetical protein [Chloroflexota bacterium]
MKLYLDRIQQRRNEKRFGAAFSSVEEQYRQTWEAPRQASPIQPPPSAKTAPPNSKSCTASWPAVTILTWPLMTPNAHTGRK